MPIAIGGSAAHNFMGRSYTGLGSEMGKGLNFFDASVASIVAAERANLDWIMCADATDFAIPISARENGEGLPDWNACFAVEPVIAVAAQLAEDIKIMWGPIDPVRRAPSVIAQMALTLDHVTKGRIILLIGEGQQNHMRQYGVQRQGTEDKLWDSVQIVKKLMSSAEAFSYHGRVWQMDRAALALPPYGESPPPLYVMGNSEEILELAGRFADGWFHFVPSEDHDVAMFGAKVGRIREYARRAGRDPDDIKICVTLEVVSSEDEAMLSRALVHPYVLWATGFVMPGNAGMFHNWGLHHPMHKEFNYMRDVTPEWIGAREFEELIARVPSEAVPKIFYCGNADAVWKQIEPWLAHHVSEARILNWANMCGPEFSPGAAHSSDRLTDLVRSYQI
jgi:phthiodiolone/phenolphthiodiolone dimycocerosates ketoreductase